ncbi:MAG: isoleucine--tRNA ligase [Coriobacteriia bacterium]|nr:isoleucine--tRNA ligase [Coriobacteriia bacterium]
MANSYKQSMNLPQTDFPMRGNLPQNEPKRLEFWNDIDIYGKVLEKNKDNEPFILHDGPPYANGPIHIGHAFNKVLKDFIVKYKSMRGYYAPYVPGWDCHGLPIENKVEEQLGKEKMSKIDTATFRKICREYATKQLDGQREGFKRLGVRGEWDNPYLTYLPEYEAGNIEIFKKLYLDGSVYRGRKPIHWCSHCHTALAEAEIEYGDEVSPSIYVKFFFTEMPEAFKEAAQAAGMGDAKSGVVIWTTTPWTLPANQAVCVSPDAEYVVAIVDGQLMVMAEELSAALIETAGWEDVSFLEKDGEKLLFPGSALAGTTYAHPIHADETGVVLTGTHVTMESGTGCVHTAPGHGVDDYNACQAAGIKDIKMPIDDEGRFYAGSCLWEGMTTDEANPAIIEWLREQGSLVAHVDINHSYPHCWRCHEPVIFRATTQWFVSMDDTGIRKASEEAIKNDVTWYPAWASNRIGAMVADRPDWCISRQRYWGVPIPVFTCDSCGETVATEATFDAVIELFKTKGADAWYTHTPADFLPADTYCPKCGAGVDHLESCTDVLDVWWESGVSHTSVCEARENLRRPADVYLEGSDQHRGWFQSSLLTSVAAYGIPPYKNVISCGFTMDKDGKKMSKSLGNTVDPNDVNKTLGADVLRMWTSSVDYSQDVSIGDEILQRTSDTYRKFRNSFRFLLGNLSDFDDSRDCVAWDELEPIDQYMMVKTANMLDTVTKAYDEYRFHHVYRAAYDFVNDLSNVYMDVAKDRLYSEAPSSKRRRAAQTVIMNILEVMVRVLAPILTFTTEEVWQHYPEAIRNRAGREESVQLTSWPSRDSFVPALPADTTALADQWTCIMEVRDVVTKALEEARAAKTIKKSQEAALEVSVPAAALAVLDAFDEAVFQELFIVASVSFHEGTELAAQVSVAEGDKCPRCWNITKIGGNANHADVCERCAAALDEIGFTEE